MKTFLQKIADGRTLSETEMIDAMNNIMSGECTNEDIKCFLLRLSERGETVEELSGGATVMRQKAVSISAPAGAVDCCGTGGDMSGTYNISTAVAIVSAACGIPVAKHGNRSSSSKSGTADVLEALGVNLDVPWSKLEDALKQFNFAFLMAPRHHQAMKHVAEVRKSLGVRTIFNLLGPLSNPAGTKFQLLGVYDRKWLRPFAQTLLNLGSTSAWVVHGSDGLDEITVTGETFIAAIENGEIKEFTLNPSDFGLSQHPASALKGGTPQDNAAALREILGGVHNAYRDIVIANTAAVLIICGKETDLKSAAAIAANTLDNGSALQCLNDYIAYTKEQSE